MSALFDELENKVRTLTLREKATLARILIEELDPSTEPGIEQLCIDEAQRRYEGYLKGEIEALPGDAVMGRARGCLKYGKN
jgi:putative addiction module component